MNPRALQPADPNFRQRVSDSFARQRVMQTLGVEIRSIEPGELTLEFPYDARLTQQHGFLHAGIISAVVDSACGYAALTLMPPGAGVLTIEFKVNLLAPAEGERFQATGRVRKPGRNITVTEGEVIALVGEKQKLVATMMGTMMTIHGRGDIVD